MFTFAVKPRLLRVRRDAKLSLPDEVTLRATLQPSWLFGAGDGVAEPRLVVRGSTGVSMFFSANSGKWYLRGGTQPPPTQAEQDVAGTLIQIKGNVAAVTFVARTTDDLTTIADLLQYGLPLALTAHLPFPCVVEHVIGISKHGEFGYEVQSLQMQAALVDEQSQNHQANNGLRDLAVFGRANQRRVQAALVYFHRASRLLEAGHSRWEFMSEAVLNLAKVLESLFPPAGDGRTRDGVRRGLNAHGVSELDAERWFVPALALRAELDVAHVWLALLSSTDIEALTTYAENAVPHFRELLQGILDRTASDDSVVEGYTAGAADDRARTVVSRIHDEMSKAGLLRREA